jgi:hypothetical protein
VTGPGSRLLTAVVCGAGPAAFVTGLIGQAAGRGWAVQVVATPAALAFIDTAVIEAQTGTPVRSQYSSPGSARSAVPDAVIVAPATYNTICKWAHGTSDTYALGILAEMTGMGLPVIVLPYVNAGAGQPRPVPPQRRIAARGGGAHPPGAGSGRTAPAAQRRRPEPFPLAPCPRRSRSSRRRAR